MPRHQVSVCRRRGCSTVRERWKLVCEECWRDIPRPQRDRYTRARRLKLTRIAGELGREILRGLGQRPAADVAPGASAPTPTEAYARTCAILGEHDA